MLNPAPLIVMVKDCCAVSGPLGAPDESVNSTVKVDVPAAVGVPEIVPLDELSERLAGGAPDVTLQV
jgi:hypothetical protein